MRSNTRNTEHTSASAAPAAPVIPDTWPNGATNPDSPFYVPDELRPHYVVNSSEEDRLFTGRRAGYDLPTIDAEIIESRESEADARKAGFNWNDLDARIRYRKQLGDRITRRDRDLHLHQRRLRVARRELQRAADAAAHWLRHGTEHACALCGLHDNSVTLLHFNAAGDRRSSAKVSDVILSEQVCPTCANVLVQSLLTRHGRTSTSDGLTIQQRADRIVAGDFLDLLEPHHTDAVLARKYRAALEAEGAAVGQLRHSLEGRRGRRAAASQGTDAKGEAGQ